MDDAPKIQPAEFSRRSLFRRLAVFVSGAAMLAVTVSESRTAAAQAKATQVSVEYQSTPKNGQACATCAQFQPPAACKTVEGKVSPAGWCKIYVKKSA